MNSLYVQNQLGILHLKAFPFWNTSRDMCFEYDFCYFAISHEFVAVFLLIKVKTKLTRF